MPQSPNEKENKEVISNLWYSPHQWGTKPERRRKIKFFKKKSFHKQRGEKCRRKYYNKPSPRNLRFV